VSEERENVVRPPRDLEAAFRQLSEHLDVPPAPDYAPRVRERLTTGSLTRRRPLGLHQPLSLSGTWRRLATATIVGLLAVAALLSVPATREAVADLFGFAGVGVRSAPSAAPSPRTTLDANLDLGDPVTLDEARDMVSFTVTTPGTPELGQPDAVYVRQQRGLESVSLAYRPRAGYPATADPQVGLLLSEYSGTATPYFEKLLESGEPMTEVTVDGRWPALYFTSPHQVLLRAPDGIVHEVRPRLSAPTLVWVERNVTYRLEAAVDLEQALAVASSMQ
jgi:hypothetical protein